MVGIKLKDVELAFTLHSAVKTSLKEYICRRLFWHGDTKKRKVLALSNVNLQLVEGQRLGVIGHNGAGKSTLLRLLAGIYVPTGGTRTVHGRVSSMLDIGVGIEPDASGWDNIMFRGYLQGMTPQQLKERAPEIAAFSELGEFLDAPVRCYSSGMHVRLAFSIATSIEPEILLIDEVFSAGDMSFQDKATRRMLDLMEKARIMVMASHDMATLRKLCENVLWLDHGQQRMLGPAAVVTEAYERHMHQLAAAA